MPCNDAQNKSSPLFYNQKMKMRLSILFFTAIGFIAFQSSAQTDTTKRSDEVIINGKKYKAVDEKDERAKKEKHTLDSTFVINNKKLKYFNDWITGGAGWQQNLTYKRNLGFAGGVDFNFHIKQRYFQLGTIISGEKYGFYNSYQFHLGYGKRFEDKDFHFAGFGGLTYTTGFAKVGDSVYTRPFNGIGLYLQGEVVKKITYDVGIGASLFADWNPEQSMIGLRFILYFSGAYMGKNNDQYMGK